MATRNTMAAGQLETTRTPAERLSTVFQQSELISIVRNENPDLPRQAYEIFLKWFKEERIQFHDEISAVFHETCFELGNIFLEDMQSIDVFAQAVFKCQNFVPESEFEEYMKTCIHRPIDGSGYREPLIISEDELEGYEEDECENMNDVN